MFNLYTLRVSFFGYKQLSLFVRSLHTDLTYSTYSCSLQKCKLTFLISRQITSAKSMHSLSGSCNTLFMFHKIEPTKIGID